MSNLSIARELSDKFLKIIDIIKNEIRTRVAPDSERLEGRNTDELKDYFVEGGESFVSPLDLADTIWCKETAWADVYHLMKGNRILDFTEAKLDTAATILSMATNNGGVWVASTTEHELFVSTDNATSWNSLLVEFALSVMRFRSGRLYGIDGYGNFYKSSDYCDTFMVVRISDNVSTYTWFVLGGENEIIVGGGHQTMCSYDDGESWQLIETEINITNAILTDAGYWLVIGADKLVYRTEGSDLRTATFIPVVELSEVIISMTVEDSGMVLFLTESSKIYKFNIITNTWTDVTPEGNFKIVKIESDSLGLVVAITDNDRLIRSYSHGDDWGCILMEYMHPIHNVAMGHDVNGDNMTVIFGREGYYLTSGLNTGNDVLDDWTLPGIQSVEGLLDYSDIDIPEGVVPLSADGKVDNGKLPNILMGNNE